MLRNILEIQTHVHFSLSPLISMSTPSCSPTHRWHLSWHKPVIMAQGTSTVWKSGTELQLPNVHNYLSTWYAQIPYISCSYRIAIGYLRRLEKNGNHFHCHLHIHILPSWQHLILPNSLKLLIQINDTREFVSSIARYNESTLKRTILKISELHTVYLIPHFITFTSVKLCHCTQYVVSVGM